MIDDSKPCIGCRFGEMRNRFINGGPREAVKTLECHHEDSKRSNNGHAPTVEFARSPNFGVCNEQGILWEPKCQTPLSMQATLDLSNT